MKRFFGLVVVLFCFVAPVVVAEERVEVNDRGEVRVFEDARETWRNLTEEEKTAYQNPGTEVPVKMVRKEAERVDFFHYVPIEKYEQVIVFSEGKLNTIEKTGERRGEEKFACYVLLLLVSALFMVISNIAMKKSVNSDAFVAVVAAAFCFAFAAAVIAALAAAAVIAALAAVIAVLAAAALVVAAVASDVKSRKIYIVCAALYYVAVVVAMVI